MYMGKGQGGHIPFSGYFGGEKVEWGRGGYSDLHSSHISSCFEFWEDTSSIYYSHKLK